MKAVVLAAGYATRLYPLTENKPKCLLKVGGVTILDRLAEQLNAISTLDEVILVTNARFYDQLNEWKKSSHARVPIRILNDKTTSNDNRLGAVGDLGLVLREAGIKDDVLLLASDNLFEQSLREFVIYARSKHDSVAIGMFDLGRPELAAKKFGVIETAASGEVTGFQEKPEKPKSSLIGMGVYYFPAATLSFVEEYLKDKNAGDAPGHFIHWLLGRVQIFSLLFRGLWYDIGDLKSLEEADQFFKSKK